jgi:AbrB family looped-hinge helix DNA binding protein
MAETLRAAMRLGAGGRLVIPARLRKALGLRPGSELLLAASDGELRVWSREQALRRAQEHVRRLVPPEVSLVDELIAGRRREAELE